ncbi:MAG: SEL1-like repeat protein, partial [Alphaproteobacteria bacterium]|nr:SEL1-like repeat protein [Alphaproteobacteria bacterium]
MAGRRTNTNTEDAARPSWSRPRDREATRLALLEAARRLIDVHGEAALTFTAVASETGIARATMYGYFSSRQQLLDLLHGETAPAPAATSEEVPTPVCGTPDTDVSATSAPSGEDSADYGELMRQQAGELDQLAKRIILPKSRIREGTESALMRLETRLHVLEQAVTEAEARRGREAKENAERSGSTAEALQRLQERLESSDARHQRAVAELHLELHNLAAGTADASTAPRPAPDATAGPADFQPWTKPLACEATHPDKTPLENGQNAYLSSARRAAINAAQKPAVKKSAAGRKRRNLWRWVLAGAILVAAELGFVFNMQPEGAVRVRAAASGQAANLPAARRSLGMLARSGNTAAQLLLGLKYLNGTGVAINIDRATGWLQRAASGGQPVAQEVLGVLYQTGTGVATDMPRAIRLYEAAAQAGNVKAMANLGKAYAGGWREGTDLEKAAQWLARAAAFGDVDAQFDLAVLYQGGQGLAQSPADAYKWYAIA